MNPTEKTLLMIRPQCQAQEFVKAAGFQGKTVFSPVTRIVDLNPPKDTELVEPFLFTSVNAVQAFSRWQKADGQLAYCVGPNTSAAARFAGFEVVNANGTAKDLVALVKGPRATYLRGKEVSFDMRTALEAKGMGVTEIMLYHQREEPLSKIALDVLKTDTVLLPVFSQNAAQRFCSQVDGAEIKDLRIAAISQNVMNCLRNLQTTEYRIADSANRAGMLALLAEMI